MGTKGVSIVCGLVSLPDEMDPDFYVWIVGLIQSKNLLPFYHDMRWQRKRAEVLDTDKRECQRCKERGVYEKANTVHHILTLEKRPDLALSMYHKGERQLLSLSSCCHEIEHGHRHRLIEPLTPERW